MKSFGENARGVMVADLSATDEELERLTRLGVRGIRFHMLPGGALPWDILEEMAARVNNFGWHVQLQMNGREFPEREALLKRLPCDLVVDHVGRFMGPVPINDPAFKVLLQFLETGRCWVKLSAPYESSESGPPDWADIRSEARALVQAAPERMLWASNWPHPGQKNPPDEGDLLDLLLDWVTAAHTAMFSALARTSDDAEVWTWTGTNQPERWVERRMTQETAVHRWDAANAVGIPYEIPVAVAADGIDEFLMWFAARRVTDGAAPVGGSVHLHCTDNGSAANGEWLVTRVDETGIDFTREHAKGDAAVRGRANDLLLWLWRRDAGAVEVLGDAGVADRFRAFPAL